MGAMTAAEACEVAECLGPPSWKTIGLSVDGREAAEGRVGRARVQSTSS
jgi:hypothetical protein